MSTRVDTSSLISGALVVGNRGLGVIGSAIPSSGANGPGYIYNDLALPADNSKEYQGLIGTPPTGGTFFAYEDSSFDFTAPNGTYSFLYQLFEDGISKGTATSTITIGGVADTTVPVMTGALSFTNITSSGFQVNYSAATDNVGVTGYEISIDNGATYPYTSTGLSYVCSGDAPNTLYYVKVRAYDAAGNRATALAGTVTTLSNATPATTIAVTFESRAAALRANLTGLKWAVFANITPDLFVAPIAKGALGTTNASGVLSVDITGKGIIVGATVGLIVFKGDGTASDPTQIGFIGVVVAS